jgi:phage baseplate assembly protein W
MNFEQTYDAFKVPAAIDRGLSELQREDSYSKHVEQLIRQVIFTNPGERINRPTFGSGIRQMLFAPNHAASASMTQVAIRQALTKWVGSHITVENVKTENNEEILNVHIQYTLKVKRERKYLNVEVTL